MQAANTPTYPSPASSVLRVGARDESSCRHASAANAAAALAATHLDLPISALLALQTISNFSLSTAAGFQQVLQG